MKQITDDSLYEYVILNNDNKIYRYDSMEFIPGIEYRCEDIEMNMKRIYLDESNSIFLSFSDFYSHFHYI